MSVRLNWPLHEPGPQGTRAGLVLLYTSGYEELPPAYLLRGREAVIGRDEAAEICVPRRSVSRPHARLEKRGDRWVLADLGGRNGTVVNGAFVTEVELADGDVIRIGDVIFKFVERGAEGYARYRIDGALVDARSSSVMALAPKALPIVGGYQIQRLGAALRDVARSALSVVILGESGTGKEVFARALHDWSGRRGAFQAVNCAAIPATLIEGELFGHQRGAFSGADRDRPGLIRAAHGGTLFLDEIGDMPVEAQAKLLRVLQTKEVVPLGATEARQIDVRVVCATHRDVSGLISRGGFRGDLFARLNEYSLTLPPLRARKEDVFALCRAFGERHGQPKVHVTFPFMTALLHYDFPFNVRELEALIKRWAAVTRGPELGVEFLSEEIQERMKTYGQQKSAPPEAPAVARAAAAPATEQPEEGDARASEPQPRQGVPSERVLRDLLAAHQGNVAAVGRVLGKDRAQVHRWVRRYGIKVNEYR